MSGGALCKTVAMGFRFTTPITLALWTGSILATLAPEAAKAQPAPRMYSPWYAEALRDVMKLEEADAARLENRLQADPDDAAARLQLMAYHQRGDRASRAEDRRKRAQHALWLIERRPGSELLHSPVSRFSPGELTPAEYARSLALWDAATKASPADSTVQWNAATFFAGLDAVRRLRYLEATAAADSNHPFALRPLAHMYAVSILNGGLLAARAREGLEASQNVWVLGNAAHILRNLYNQTLQSGTPDARAAELAERYFLRAKALDPNLDRKAILPVIDLGEITRARLRDEQAGRDWLSRAEAAVSKVERLPVEAFPRLPSAIASVLRDHNCTVPQPEPRGKARNVISGAFFAAGEEGWAVLCSARHSTALLVFRNDGDRSPVSLSTSEDRNYLQDLGGGRVGYSREIRAVDGEFIMGHYRAYGGPEPPPIEHLGIDDAFLGKASVTWYFHGGKWLRLQGAD